MPQLTEPKGNSFIYTETGIQIIKAVILEVTDLSNHPIKGESKSMGTKGFIPDICLDITLDYTMFKRNLRLFGKYMRDKVTNKITGWKESGNDVQRFLFRVLGDKAIINSDYSIPEKTINFLTNKEIYVLRYCSDTYNEKPSYKEYPRFILANLDYTKLLEEFKEKTPRDFKPELVEEWEMKRSNENNETEIEDSIDSTPMPF